MNFFKHFVDAHDSTPMMNLMDKWGVQGYGAFFILMELAIDKIDKAKDEEFGLDHCRVRIHGRILRQKLRLSSTKLERFLNQCSTEVLLSFEKVGDEFHFFIPKILNFLDRDAKRARAERGPPALKKEKKKEILEEEGEGQTSSPTFSTGVNSGEEIAPDRAPINAAAKFEARFHPEAPKIVEGLKVLGVEGSLRSNLSELISRFQNYETFREWANALADSADKKKFDGEAARVRYMTVAIRREIGLIS